MDYDYWKKQSPESLLFPNIEWNKPEQDTSDANLKEWAVILSPQANNPNAKKALGYLKQMQGMTKK